jgi:putative ATP-binding cassette transporter
MELDSEARDRSRPPELEHDTFWRDARYWLGLQARFVAASPVLGLGVLLLLIAGVVLEHAMVVNTLVATGRLTDALVGRGGPRVQAAATELGISALLMLIGTLTAWFGRYAYQFLWRAHFTQRLLAGWFADDRYYHLEREGRIGNPEQRIQEDLYFVGFWTVWLLPFFIGAATSGTYAWVLVLQMSFPLSLAPLGLPLTLPLGLFTACLLMALARVAGAHLAGQRITRFEIIRRRLDADFRHELADVREFGEAIALQRGAGRERQRALALFARIGANWWRLTRAQMSLAAANGVTSALSRLIPPLVCIEPILAHRLTIGKLVVATSTFTLAMQLISVFADEYSTIAWLRASVARIRLLEQALGQPAAAGPQIEEGGDRLEAAGLAILLPSGEKLLDVAGLSVAPGQRIAIGGRSGSGKSTLLRTLAGLWPHAAGRVKRPLAERVLFLPQRPYLPNDTLAAVLSYPDAADRFDRARLASVLVACGLPKLVGRLAEAAPWRSVLSPGEQQRVSAARALLRAPDFLIVDEPTSALDPASEAEVYQALDAGLPNAAIVTVAHSRQLAAFHGDEFEVRHGELVRRTAPAAAT